MNHAIIYDGTRSPFGRYGGVLSGKRPDDLLADVIRGLLKRSEIDSGLVEDVIMGNTNQAGEDCRNVARNAALLAGARVSAGGLTVNRLCGSGLAATLDAARAISCEQGQLFIAGGVESMSRAPWVLSKVYVLTDYDSHGFHIVGYFSKVGTCTPTDCMTVQCIQLLSNSELIEAPLFINATSLP